MACRYENEGLKVKKNTENSKNMKRKILASGPVQDAQCENMH